MAGSGELYLRADGKWGYYVKDSDGYIVATDGGSGFDSKESARGILERLMQGIYNGPIEVVGAK